MKIFDYECKTTFPLDFEIAQAFGPDAIRDTFNRAFEEWKDNVVYMTELVMVLNHKIWETYKTNPELGELYNELWEKADAYCCDNFIGEDLTYFYQTTD